MIISKMCDLVTWSTLSIRWDQHEVRRDRRPVLEENRRTKLWLIQNDGAMSLAKQEHEK